MRLLRRTHGFSLIELLVFIIVTSLVMSTILLSTTTALRNAPTTHQQWVAIEAAQRCMEYFLNQRRINGYASLTCPSTPSASACSAPTGFSVSTSISCTPWNADAEYKTITVSVSGLASVSISSQVGNYQ
jgi:type II secretory pathway pseudopilin PulG